MSHFQKSPIKQEVEAGRNYFKCHCGTSATFPFCDGSHTGTGKGPKVLKPEQSGTVFLCACGKSDTALCNGSHSKA